MPISEAAAETVHPEDGVPEHAVNAALPLASVTHFKPSLLGPASMRDPAALAPEGAEDVEHESEDG